MLLLTSASFFEWVLAWGTLSLSLSLSHTHTHTHTHTRYRNKMNLDLRCAVCVRLFPEFHVRSRLAPDWIIKTEEWDN